MRNRFAEVFFELAQSDDRLCLLVADISPAGSIEKFRKNYPARFINTGVAEQIMIGMSAGMAQRGLRPFAYTIATFALYRTYEFIRNDLAYQNLPVTVVGIGGGITYSTLGATHHAQEDIAVASTIPGLRIIAPSDPAETEAATRWCAVQQDGPVYLRLGKAGEPDLTSHLKTPWTFGKWRQVVAGSDLAIITYGTIASQCVKAVHMVQEHGLFPSLYFATTIEPMDFQTIDEIFSRYRNVLIVEEHVSFGGIGMRLKALGTQLSSGLHIHLISLPNSFSHSYGKHEELLFLNNLDANSIAQRIKKISS
jgi:transketolase